MYGVFVGLHVAKQNAFAEARYSAPVFEMRFEKEA